MYNDPPHADHGTKTSKWQTVWQAVHDFNRHMGMKSIKLHYKNMLTNFEGIKN